MTDILAWLIVGTVATQLLVWAIKRRDSQPGDGV